MENIIRCLDIAAKQRARSPQKKMSVAGLLDHLSFRVPTVEEAAAQSVPNRFPWDTFSPKYLTQVGEFQADHLSSKAMGLDAMSKEMVRKLGAIANSPELNNHPPAGGSSAVAGPSSVRAEEAGPSGGEVAMLD